MECVPERVPSTANCESSYFHCNREFAIGQVVRSSWQNAPLDHLRGHPLTWRPRENGSFVNGSHSA
jgi:hypothetical protein